MSAENPEKAVHAQPCVVISACLIGRRCRYDARVRTAERWAKEFDSGDTEFVAVCPEELGGLSTPRPPADLVGGDGAAVLDGVARVETDDGTDVTRAFVEGARRALEIAKQHGATRAVLKSRSPSCGCGARATFAGDVVPENGVFAELCKRSGLEVESAEFDR